MSGSSIGASWPAWLREIDSLLAVHPQFVLSGNVRDRYRLPLPDLPLVDTITEALNAALRRAGFDALLVHDVIDGYRIVSDDPEAAWASVRELVGMDLRSERADDLGTLADVMRQFAAGGGRRMALVLDYASQITGSVNELGPREQAFFASCLKLSHEAAPHIEHDADRRALYNPVFWVVEREHDLPAWLTAQNRGIRSIPVPWPALADRGGQPRPCSRARGGERIVSMLLSTSRPEPRA